MAEYDSILKEKKKYVEPPVVKKDDIKKFPWLKIDLICIIVILVISYIIYFIVILSPKQIFLNDIKMLFDKYYVVLEPLNIDRLSDLSYGMIGNINLDDKVYDFKLSKDGEKIKFNLALDKANLNYYGVSNNGYVKVSDYKEEYHKLGSDYNYIAIISNLKNYLKNNLDDDKFIKKFYFNDVIPIVESNFVLGDEDIKEALNLSALDNSYEIVFTFKNNAITNEIISMKMVINNLDTSDRKMILYEDDYLTYKDDNQNLKFGLDVRDKDFTLKIYKNDSIFSALEGSQQESSYLYDYKIIYEIYNIKLRVSQENDINSYEFESIIEENDISKTKKINLTFNYASDVLVDGYPVDSDINYEKLTGDEKKQYKMSLENIIGELRQFIEEYK